MNPKASLWTRFLPFALALVLFPVLMPSAVAQIGVQDIFGRSVNQHGVSLVDWDGYLANPLIKLYVFAPSNATLPGSATLTANGGRLYFDTPSTVGSNGPPRPSR
jgi:hypothetical protein